jgi:hypothetical protein
MLKHTSVKAVQIDWEFRQHVFWISTAKKTAWLALSENSVHHSHNKIATKLGVNPPFSDTATDRILLIYGDGSKPCTPGEHQNSW